ncbi:MAG: GNAT family N-acyltransferase [Blastocatellia bacterium]|nr:GNAT family N-acyltransferase [Blastocatellia bacterium]
MISTARALQAQPIRSGSLEVRLATSFIEIDAAMRLRFEVFNLELQEGLLSSFDRGYDSDAYDSYCDHLVVNDLPTGRIVGTYRLLRRSVADRNIGFYSENEFDLSNLRRLPGELVELGRSCIARSHRSFATINLLWTAITQYAIEHNAPYLFGCGSLHTSNRQEVARIYSWLRENHFAPEKFRVHPVPSCRMELEEGADAAHDRETIRKVSPIIKGYLRAGARVCGAPAYDEEFGTADVPILMEMERMAGRYKQHYAVEADARR